MAKKKKNENQYRMRKEDLATAIYRPKQTRKKVVSNKSRREFVVYTILGKEDGIDNDGFPILYDLVVGKQSTPATERAEAFAKKIVTNSNTKCQYHYIW